MHKDTIFHINNDTSFNEVALKYFQFHYRNNEVYHTFISLLHGKDFKQPQHWKEIPCLPISFFKSHTLYKGQSQPETIFTSSGTSGLGDSRHHLDSLSWYHKVCSEAFQRVFGQIENYAFVCLLPSYLERSGSSLIEMCKYFIEKSGKGGFYLDNYDEMFADLKSFQKTNTPVMLFGVSFALLDLAEKNPDPEIFQNATIVETGGMKGRRKEITRLELHQTLKTVFGKNHIASEYGMTELLSQAYAPSDGVFIPPPWMRLYTRNPADPLSRLPEGSTGLLNIIDLANKNSMPFIAVDDIGKVYDNGRFEVLGRYDQADIRGCNLMVV
ncbi:MAG: acyl transferase [Cryomorphaceae bacterium]|nr:acyl transferase [Cryomorphaceae bacterium]